MNLTRKLTGLISKLRLIALKATGLGSGISLFSNTHFSAEITEQINGQMVIERGATISRGCWVNVPNTLTSTCILHLGARAFVGRQSVISAMNRVTIEHDCLISPHALIMDHAHAFADPGIPIIRQGSTPGGTIVLESGCWIGYGAAVIANRGEVRIGRNSVVGANTVVTQSVPPFVVVVGNPARIVKRFDATKNVWESINEPLRNTRLQETQ